jgi:hypothetical protein
MTASAIRGIRRGIGLICGAALAVCGASAATYTDAARGFAIDYPDGWTVDPTFVDKGYGFFQGESEDVHGGVAFAPSADLAPGTVLQSDQLKLVVQRARPADRCEAGAFLVDPPPDYFTKTVLDKPEAVQTVAEAGDQYVIEHLVVMVSQKPCLAVHYIIVAARQGRAFDHAKLVDYLNGIAKTIRPTP